MKTQLFKILPVLFSTFLVLGKAGFVTAAIHSPETKTTLITIEVCTDVSWYEPSTGQFAVIQPNGPTPGGLHDIPNAEPIWGQDIAPDTSTTLTREFNLPTDAMNISGTITFVADDGVTLFLNSEEIGNYDAMVWPPPEVKTLANLQPGTNQLQANIYNRPGYAWFEACATITYETESYAVYLPFITNNYFTPNRMPILQLAYYPPAPGNSDYLDPVETGLSNRMISDIQNHVRTLTNNFVANLNDSTRYHGYSNPTAPKFLEYYVFYQQDFFYAMPRGYKLPWGPYRPDYGQIMRDIDICTYIDTYGVKEVWIYGYHSNVIEPDESKMSSRYGDISNAWPKDEYIPEEYRLPRCTNSYVMYNFNYGREEINLHNQMHQVENVIGYVDYTLFWNDFSERVYHDTQHSYRSSCGNTHYTPNWVTPEDDYNYGLTNYRENNCETWHPDDSQTTYVNTNCTQWGCTEIGFDRWFLQNMPGYNNGIEYNGKKMRNWWEVIYDFNQFIDSGRTLYTD